MSLPPLDLLEDEADGGCSWYRSSTESKAAKAISVADPR